MPSYALISHQILSDERPKCATCTAPAGRQQKLLEEVRGSTGPQKAMEIMMETSDESGFMMVLVYVFVGWSSISEPVYEPLILFKQDEAGLL